MGCAAEEKLDGDDFGGDVRIGHDHLDGGLDPEYVQEGMRACVEMDQEIALELSSGTSEESSQRFDVVFAVPGYFWPGFRCHGRPCIDHPDLTYVRTIQILQTI